MVTHNMFAKGYFDLLENRLSQFYEQCVSEMFARVWYDGIDNVRSAFVVIMADIILVGYNMNTFSSNWKSKK